jgi:hypothetical protein
VALWPYDNFKCGMMRRGVAYGSGRERAKAYDRENARKSRSQRTVKLLYATFLIEFRREAA